MSGFSPIMTITDQDTRTVQASPSIGTSPWGQRAMTSDGRSFAYAANKSTTVALTAGQLTKSNVTVQGNHVNRTGVAYSAGASQVVFTIGNTAITADQYTYGRFVVNKVTGAGQSLLINGHNTPSGNGSVTVNLGDYIITATDTTSKFSLYPQIFSNVVVSSSSGTIDRVTGVPLTSITAATTANPFTIYWSQVGGECAVLADASSWVNVNDGIIQSALTAGAVGLEAQTTITQRLGYAMDQLVSTEYRPVMLTGLSIL